ncbi:ISAs1 family transposase [Streptomyces sp. NPDC017202]|uniref:ISAs1 family transposase n=1 Tax=Streptomyces sp. NPDC017202 TaxID=3364981 RepID=UPI00379FAAF1
MCRQSATACLIKSPSPATRELSVLTDRLTALPDPRDRRGRRHSLVAVLPTAVCAALAGARSCLAIGQRARHAPQHTLARLGIRAHGPLGVRTPPSASTLRRVLVAVCPGGPADLLGTDPAGTDTVAVDGKTARGSRTGTQAAAHLLAAATGTGHTATQLRVPTKTNEVTGFARLLAPFDLTGVTVTADALHTRCDPARHLIEDKNAHHLLLVKGNQPRLHAALRSLPRSQVQARRSTTANAGTGGARPAPPACSPSPTSTWTSPTWSRPRRSCGTARTSARARSPARPSTSSPT